MIRFYLIILMIIVAKNEDIPHYQSPYEDLDEEQRDLKDSFD